MYKCACLQVLQHVIIRHEIDNVTEGWCFIPTFQYDQQAKSIIKGFSNLKAEKLYNCTLFEYHTELVKFKNNKGHFYYRWSSFIY